MIAYKIMRMNRDHSFGSLYVLRDIKYHIGVNYHAQDGQPKNLAHRPGFHATTEPFAPHITLTPASGENRLWVEVLLGGKIEEFKRPSNQGGKWLIAEQMKPLKIYEK